MSPETDVHSMCRCASICHGRVVSVHLPWQTRSFAINFNQRPVRNEYVCPMQMAVTATATSAVAATAKNSWDAVEHSLHHLHHHHHRHRHLCSIPSSRWLSLKRCNCFRCQLIIHDDDDDDGNVLSTSCVDVQCSSTFRWHSQPSQPLQQQQPMLKWRRRRW